MSMCTKIQTMDNVGWLHDGIRSDEQRRRCAEFEARWLRTDVGQQVAAVVVVEEDDFLGLYFDSVCADDKPSVAGGPFDDGLLGVTCRPGNGCHECEAGHPERCCWVGFDEYADDFEGDDGPTQYNCVDSGEPGLCTACGDGRLDECFFL